MSSPAFFPSDAEARLRALAPDTSFLVQAPAGSGKTSLLSQRFLRLLALAERPEEILAITFTRKAAAEMRTRILGELRAASRNVPVTQAHERLSRELAEAALRRDQERGWGILESPHRLRIQTMDSFQAALVGRLPWLSRFGMAAESTDRPQPIYLEAVRQALISMAQGTDREAVIAVLNLFDNKMDTIAASLATLVAKRDQWMPILGATPFVGQDPAEVRRVLEKGMERVLAMELRRLRARMPRELGPRLAACAGAAASAHPDEKTSAQLAEISDWPSDGVEALPQWRVLAGWLLTDGGEVRKRITKNEGFPPGSEAKPAMEDLLEDLRSQDGFAQDLNAVRGLPKPLYEDAEWRVLEALLRFLGALLPRLWLEFGLRGKTDFTEVSLRAMDALEADPGVPSLLAERLDARIQHILVDEFQDTSVLQMQLLRRLTENWERGDGRTLFLVGDPMQSIYYWRNARVDLFLRAWSGELAGLPGLETLRLTRNFRSRRGLIDTFNQFFARQFPDADNADQGAVRYSAAEAGPGDPGTAEPAVHYHAFLCDSQKLEAAWIAEAVERMQDEDKRQKRSRSIGILFRARREAHAVSVALQERGIRYQAVDVDPLVSLQVVRDLRSLLSALLSTRDRLSWLSVLRAPWNGFTLDQLEFLARLAGDGPIWEAILRALEPDSPLDEDARLRLLRTREIFTEAFRWRGRLPLAHVLRQLWLRSGAAAYHGDARSRMAADAFLRTLQDLDEGELLGSLQPLDEALATLQAPPDPEAPATLQLLTIHKAKGLEFDAVFLPCLHRGTPNSENPALTWEEVALSAASAAEAEDIPQIAVLLAPRSAPGAGPSDVYQWIKERKKQREANEALRVLYVGFTRARQELHLLATLDPSKFASAADLKPQSGSHLKRLWEQFQPLFQEKWEQREAAAAEDALPAYSLLRRMQTSALPALTVPVERPATRAAGNGERFFRPEGTFETLDTAAGTVFHRLMQRVDGGRWRDSSVAAERLRPLVMEELRTLLPGEPALDALADRVVAAFRRAASSAIAAEFFLSTHTQVASEQTVGYFEGGAFRTARIDRCFRDTNGLLHVVDFKLVAEDAKEEEGFKARHRALYQSQLERYARLLQQERAEPVCLTLYYPLQDLHDRWTVAPLASGA